MVNYDHFLKLVKNLVKINGLLKFSSINIIQKESLSEENSINSWGLLVTEERNFWMA